MAHSVCTTTTTTASNLWPTKTTSAQARAELRLHWIFNMSLSIGADMACSWQQLAGATSPSDASELRAPSTPSASALCVASHPRAPDSDICSSEVKPFLQGSHQYSSPAHRATLASVRCQKWHLRTPPLLRRWPWGGFLVSDFPAGLEQPPCLQLAAPSTESQVVRAL